MKLHIFENDNILKTDNSYECAAWWENRKILPGAYELKKVKKGYGKYFYAKCSAEIQLNYFGSLFGGVAVGSYDTKKDFGKKSEHVLQISFIDILFHKNVQLTESEYEEMLPFCRDQIKTELQRYIERLSEYIEKDSGIMINHCGKNIEELSRKLEEINTAMSRREVNRKAIDRGDKAPNTDIYCTRFIEFKSDK